MGTISEKISYLAGTKQRQKTLINALGGNITNDTPFREYEQELIGVLPKVTGEGTNISLSPTIEYDLEVKSLKGDTTQNTLTGKNLFNIATKKDYYWLWSDGGIGTSNDPNIVSDFIPTTSGQQYVISGIPAGMSLRVCSYSSTNTSSFVSVLINNVGDLKTFTANSNYIVFAIGSGNAVALTEIQMEKGSTATSYEPYCGGIPSPNPNYPQDIQVVTGTQTVTISNADNTESQTYNIHLGEEELVEIPNTNYIDTFKFNNNKWYKGKKVEKIASYNGETISTDYISTTGQLTTGAKVYYGIQEQDIEITDTTLLSDLNNIKENAMSYSGTTNISTSGDLPFILKVRALKGV